METRAEYVLVGTFVVVLLACLLAAVLWLARIQFGEQRAYYDIYFSGSVTGLNRGSTVRYIGIPVGRVVDVRLDPQDQQRVRVTIEIEGDTVIKSDAVASLEIQGLTGGTFVALSGGSPAAPPLEAKGDERYPVIASRPSGFERVLTGAPELLSRVIILSEQLSDVLNAHNRAALSETLDNLRAITGAAASHGGEIEAMLNDGAAAFHEAHNTLATANGAVADLRGTLTKANGAIADLRQILAPDGDARKAIKDADDTLHRLGGAADNVSGLVQDNRAGLKEFVGTGLPQVQQLIAQAQVLIAQLGRVAEAVERDPARFLYGDRREGYQPR